MIYEDSPNTAGHASKKKPKEKTRRKMREMVKHKCRNGKFKKRKRIFTGNKGCKLAQNKRQRVRRELKKKRKKKMKNWIRVPLKATGSRAQYLKKKNTITSKT